MKLPSRAVPFKRTAHWGRWPKNHKLSFNSNTSLHAFAVRFVLVWTSAAILVLWFWYACVKQEQIVGNLVPRPFDVLRACPTKSRKTRARVCRTLGRLLVYRRHFHWSAFVGSASRWNSSTRWIETNYWASPYRAVRSCTGLCRIVQARIVR